MRLTGQDELHGLPCIGQQPDQSVLILKQQIGSLVHHEAAGEAQSQRNVVEHPAGAFNLQAGLVREGYITDEDRLPCVEVRMGNSRRMAE